MNTPIQSTHAQQLESLQSALTGFDPISLADIQGAALLNRVDTKYIIGLPDLHTILTGIIPDYRVLTINNTRLHAYQTLYFDTANFAFYEQHHNGLASRYKVRARHYVETDQSFFEIKHRTNQRRTVKSRVPIARVAPYLDEHAMTFASQQLPFDASTFEPKLWNNYRRMTLVSTTRPERVTLDIDLEYRWRDAAVTLPGLVIVEVKRERLSQESAFIRHMRTMGIRPLSYSKYTAGVYSLYDNMRTNNFKSQIRQVNKVLWGEFQS